MIQDSENDKEYKHDLILASADKGDEDIDLGDDADDDDEDDLYDLNETAGNNLSFNELDPDGNPNNDSQSSILRGKWTPSEDELLKRAVDEFGGKNWRRISSRIEGRTDVQCLHRWQKVLRPGLVKGPWTKEV